MWRETCILSLLIVFTSTAGAINDGDVHRTLGVDLNPSINIKEFDLLDHNDHDLWEDMAYNDREMRIGDDDNPFHFLPLDNQDNPILVPLTPPKTRMLSKKSSRIGTFYPLDCNPTSWSSCSSFGPSDIPTDSNPLVVPCGECYQFDITGNVTLNGLDIRGKLLFPVNQNVNIFTPFVIVQGELEINVNHGKISPDNLATRFTLTGKDNVIFTPSHEPNLNACEKFSDGCNIGVKPFLVAGGKVNIISMPETCATHTPIQKKIYKDPIYDTENFAKSVTLPPSCPQSGINFVSYDFDDNEYGNWKGREGAFVVMEDGAMKITNRKIKSRGPEIDITSMHPELCLIPGQEYLLSSR